MENIKNRKLYLDRIMPFVDKDLIKVIVGLRRTGKSFMLKQIIKYLKKKGIESRNIIYIDKEDKNFNFIENDKNLNDYIEKKKGKGKNYLFVDEVQEIQNFTKVIRSYNLDPKFDVYITGSNSQILSSDIAGLLSGRYIEFPIYSLNFQEFIEFHSLKETQETLELFLKFGGMPYLTQLGLKKEISDEYIRNIFNTIILKDVVKRHNIRNVAFLEKLVAFLADNTGFNFSDNKIINYLRSNKVTDISRKIVTEYLEYILEMFLFYKVRRKDIKGRKVLVTSPKYYIGDLGFRNFILEERPREVDQVIENVVYLHLKSLGYKVHVGNYYNKEIDFVAIKGDRKIYVQVAYLIPNQKVFDREFGNLELIKDSYEKFVVSMDPMTRGVYKGIRHFKLLDFLLEKGL